MTTDLRKVSFRVPHGTMSWEAFDPWFGAVLREILAKTDARNPQSDIASAFLFANGIGTLGDAARSTNQKVLNQVSVANRNSVQSTDTILTATSGASTSTISIASHSVKYDFGSVAYGAGTITGLTPETVYYVYTSDPDKVGSASPTYLATTNPDNLIATGTYYVGFVATPITGSSGNISAATKANPCEITMSAAHGWSNGNEVDFAGFTDSGWTVLNTGNFTITVTGLNKFTIPIDTSGYAASYTSGATATRVTTAVQSGGGAGAGVGGGRFDYTVQVP